MPLTLTCSCGKTLAVPDHLIGKKVKCNSCQSILVALNPGVPDPSFPDVQAMPIKADRSSPPPAPPRRPGEKETPHAPVRAVPKSAAKFPTGSRKKQGPVQEAKFHMSFGMMLLVGAIVIIPTVLFIVKNTTMKTNDRWFKMQEEAEQQVIDLTTDAIQRVLKKEGWWDGKDPRHQPHANDCTFIWTMMVVKMPETVGFVGHSTEGEFRGRIHPETGVIELEMEIAGKQRKIVGKVNPDKVTLDVDGVDMSK